MDQSSLVVEGKYLGVAIEVVAMGLVDTGNLEDIL